MVNIDISFSLLYSTLQNLLSKWAPMALDKVNKRNPKAIQFNPKSFKEEENMLSESISNFDGYCKRCMIEHRKRFAPSKRNSGEEFEYLLKWVNTFPSFLAHFRNRLRKQIECFLGAWRSFERASSIRRFFPSRDLSMLMSRLSYRYVGMGWRNGLQRSKNGKYQRFIFRRVQRSISCKLWSSIKTMIPARNYSRFSSSLMELARGENWLSHLSVTKTLPSDSSTTPSQSRTSSDRTMPPLLCPSSIEWFAFSVELLLIDMIQLSEYLTSEMMSEKKADLRTQVNMLTNRIMFSCYLVCYHQISDCLIKRGSNFTLA